MEDTNNADNDNLNINLVASYIIKNASLPDLMENLSQTTLKWGRSDFSAVCSCPMPWHKDKNASFHLNRMDNNAWVFNCFGCGSKGNIVSYYMQYTGEEDFRKAVIDICKLLNITVSNDNLQSQMYSQMCRKVDKKKEIETANIIASNQCRLLLRKNFEKHSKWVMNAYKELNSALDTENSEEIERIGHEASKRTRGDK